MTNSYNGWKNYETWQCSTWIDNEPSLYFSAIETSNAEALRELVASYLFEQYQPSKTNLLTDIIVGWETEVDFEEIFKTRFEETAPGLGVQS